MVVRPWSEPAMSPSRTGRECVQTCVQVGKCNMDQSSVCNGSLPHILLSDISRGSLHQTSNTARTRAVSYNHILDFMPHSEHHAAPAPHVQAWRSPRSCRCRLPKQRRRATHMSTRLMDPGTNCPSQLGTLSKPPGAHLQGHQLQSAGLPGPFTATPHL